MPPLRICTACAVNAQACLIFIHIFLNIKGTNREEAGEELAQFLEYAEKTDEITALNSGSEKIRRIREHIRMLKSSEEMGVKYMQAWEERLQVLEEGLEKGIQLTKEVLKLSAQGRSESEISELCGISPEQVRRILDT
ncbi:helix-turn-helix domain-containing protein [Eisenbergiella sp.]